MKKGKTFVYLYSENAYVNLTNRCCNDCVFCLRNNADGILNNVLWLLREPTAAEVIEQLQRLEGQYRDVVFCGYGEPTYRMEEMLKVATFVRGLGKKIRLNTNGLGSAINKFDIVPFLKEYIDSVSVSLNTSAADRYAAVCRSSFGKEAYAHILDFSAKCVKAGIKTVLSVVDIISEEEIEACRAVAEKTGAEFRVRQTINDNKNYR